MQKTIFNILLTGLILSANLQIDAAAPNNIDQEITTLLNKKLLDTAHTEKIQTIKTLIAMGADLETTDNDGNTPLILAAMRDKPNIAEALILAGANPNTTNIYGNSASYFAACEGRNEKLLEILIKKGARVDTVNVGGNTPLMERLLRYAFRTHHCANPSCCKPEKIVNILIKAGTTIDATFDAYKNTLIERCPIREHINPKIVTQEASGSPAERVPGEILMLILKLLPEQDIAHFRTVNSHWCLHAHDLFKQYKNKRAADNLKAKVKQMMRGIQTINMQNKESERFFFDSEYDKLNSKLKKTETLNLFSPEAVCLRKYSKTSPASTEQIKKHTQDNLDKLQKQIDELNKKAQRLIPEATQWSFFINVQQYSDMGPTQEDLSRRKKASQDCHAALNVLEKIIETYEQFGTTKKLLQTIYPDEQLTQQKQALLDTIEQLEKIEKIYRAARTIKTATSTNTYFWGQND